MGDSSWEPFGYQVFGCCATGKTFSLALCLDFSHILLINSCFLWLGWGVHQVPLILQVMCLKERRDYLLRIPSL